MKVSDIEKILEEIDMVLGYGSSWDASGYLSKLRGKLKTMLTEEAE